MQTHLELTYNHTVDEKTYTREPQKTISIQRLIQSKPYWEQLTSSSRREKKTLVLSDWTADSWSNTLRVEMLLLFSDLLEQGFSIYLWQTNVLKQLRDVEVFNNADVLSKITPEYPQRILQLAVQQLNLSADTIHLLDDYQLTLLQGKSPSEPRSIRLSALSDDCSYKLMIKTLLRTCKPHVVFIRQDVFSDDTITADLRLKAFWGDLQLPILEDYKSALNPIDYRDVNTQNVKALKSFESLVLKRHLEGFIPGPTNLFSERWPAFTRLKSLTIDTLSAFKALVNVLDLTHLQQLKITALESNLDVSDIVCVALNLIVLELKGKIGIKVDVSRQTPTGFEKIKRLKLEYVTTTSECIQSLTSSGTLTYLNLSYVSILGDVIFTQHALARLKACILTGSCGQNIDTILRETNGLIHFNLMLNIPYIFSAHALASLSKLHSLSVGKITPNQLVQLLSHGEDVVTLTIRSVINAPYKPGSLIQLKKLTNLTITDSCLFWFDTSLNVPILRELRLECCSNLSQYLPALSKLQCFRMINMLISASSIHKILISTPIIEIIELDCVLIDGFFGHRSPQLPLLSSLSIKGGGETVIDADMIYFFNTASVLTHLNLDDLENLHWYFIKNINFSSLEFLSIVNTRIPTDKFKYLLQKLHQECKQLKNINVAGQFHFNDPQLIDLIAGLGDVLTGSITPGDEEIRDDEPRVGNTLASVFMDANTKRNPTIQLNTKQLFYATQGSNHPWVGCYRRQLFDTLVMIDKPRSIDQAFTLEHAANNCFAPISKSPESNDVFALASRYDKPCFYGKQSFYLGHQWQAIASLTPIDNLQCYHVENDIDVDLSYSLHNNLYYIRTRDDAGSRFVKLDFLMTHVAQPSLPKDIQDHVDDFNSYGEGALKLDPQALLSGRDLLLAMRSQRVGSCRHRAIVFKSLMNQRGIPARIILNDCHAFVEVCIDEHWLTCDLGGYQVQLTIDESNKPKLEPEISERQLAFQRRLTTWRAPEAPADYIANLLSGDYKSQLIHANSSALVQLGLRIQMEATKKGHPVFYINRPDDIICTAPFLKRLATNRGVWLRGGGALYEFLKAVENRACLAPVLIVNYNHFSAEDKVRFNGLLDKHPHADGLALRADTIVCGLMDPDKPNAYQGADFCSRFSRIENSPSLGELSLPSILIPLPTVAPTDRYVINLCHSSGWLTQLMGGWVILDGAPYFDQGELVPALKSDKAIELLNPPHDDAFDFFWQHAQLNGAIVHEGEITPLSNVVIYFSHGYNRNHVSVTYGPLSAQAHVINPGVLSTFISQYQFVNGKLTKTPGIIELQGKNGILSLFVTRNLTEDESERLRCEANKHHVSFRIGPVPQASVPSTHVTCIHTTDRDLTLAQLTAGNHPWVIIDCTECTASDLLETIDGRKFGEVPHIQFEFNKKQQALVRALDEGKRVILTGDFSDALRDELAPFLIKRAALHQAKGALILITEKPFTYLPNRYENPTPQVKLNYLKQYPYARSENLNRLINEMPNCLTTLSFNQLKTRLIYLDINPSVLTSRNFYKGFETVAMSKPSLQRINMNTVNAEAAAFHEHRYLMVNIAMHSAPYVYIAGLTGVGKSFFVEHILAKQQRYQLSCGDDTPTLQAWASKRSHSDWLVLFIDEANLSPRQWSQFEGLFHNPPGILIAGTYYPLTRQHRVIFAGNPLSYGDARHVASLFQRHATALVFEPLSLAVIYDSFIKPILTITRRLSIPCLDAISDSVLQVYKFFVEIAEDEVLISPRQLQMIMLLIMNYANHRAHVSEYDIIHMTHFYIRDICAPFVPKAQLVNFNQYFPVIDRILFDSVHPPVQGPTGHFYTPSRLAASNQLVDFLNLRKALINNRGCRYTGLNRLVIEGEAGIGKSEWIMDLLQLRNEPVYHIQVSMHPDEQLRLILDAFDRGYIVVMDEINSISQKEQFMNSILDDRHPYEQHRRAHRPGFRIIGTQNSANLAGRSLASPALNNRTLTIRLEQYTTGEMIDILNHMKLPVSDCHLLVAAFEHNVSDAKANNLSPAPIFRDLITLANELLGHEKQCLSGIQTGYGFFRGQNEEASATSGASCTCTPY